MAGFFKVYRVIYDYEWSRSPNHIAILMLLLKQADHKPYNCLWKKEKMVIPNGTVCISRKNIAQLSGVKPTTVERVLQFFTKKGIITQQTSPLNRLITINYDFLNPKYSQNSEKADNPTHGLNGSPTTIYDNNSKNSGQRISAVRYDKNGGLSGSLSNNKDEKTTFLEQGGQLNGQGVDNPNLGRDGSLSDSYEGQNLGRGFKVDSEVDNHTLYSYKTIKEIYKEKFFSDRFYEIWDMWVEYRKNELGRVYKQPETERIAIHHLYKLAEGDEELAENMINDAISAGYTMFYKPKKSKTENKAIKRKINVLNK